MGLSESKEQLETLEEESFSIMQIAKQARNKRGQKLFQIFRHKGEWSVHCQLVEVGYTTGRIGGAGKTLSGPEGRGDTAVRKTRSTDWHGGEQE